MGVCPNCGKPMKMKYCIHCGYMTNGIFINTKKPIKFTLLEIYFGDKYEKITCNGNWFVAGLLGPLYIFCHNFYLFGLLLLISDFVISIVSLIFMHTLIHPAFGTLMNSIYWFTNRLFWATINNMIYIRLINKKLVKCQEKYPNDYKEKIAVMYEKDNRTLGFKYFFFFIIHFFVFNILKALIINYLHLYF